MSSTIIELSRITSNETESNSQWKNTLKSGIILEEGDQVLVKNAYVDTTTLSSNNFVFTEDIPIRIEFGFYLLCTGIEQVSLSGGYSTSDQTLFNITTLEYPDGLPYICINQNPQDPKKGEAYIDFVEFTIPAGTYSKTYLSQYISRRMQSLNITSQSLWPGVWSNYPQDPNSNPPPPYPVVESVFQQLYLQNQAPYGADGFWECSMGIPPIPFAPGSGNTVISPAHCDISFYAWLTDLPTQNTYLYNEIFQKCQAVDADFDGGYMGCPNMSISFNNDSQKYQWDYLHTSITDSNQNELTAIIYGLQEGQRDKFVFANQRGGLMLTKLEPVSFWRDTLGFELDKILFDSTFSNTTYNEWYSKTTQNFPSVSQLINERATLPLAGYTLQSLTTIISNPQPYKFTQSTSTIPIIAPNLSIGTIISAGHYLVDIKGYSTNYKNAFGDNQYKATVSAFFTSPDNFLCSPGPDSSFYIHHGSPIPLNSFEISIIDPLTHKPSDNLGKNSSVYLQVIKNDKSTKKNID
jgi:hypothetical protein